MTNSSGLTSVKVIALAVTDVGRARNFYSKILELEEDTGSTDETGYKIGSAVLILRKEYPPTEDPNPRITLQAQDARATESFLRDRGVTVSDPVMLYMGKFLLGAFLDSEGNKLWFCSYA
jgi:predicted enzyme related to lactoylglutathione lyase